MSINKVKNLMINHILHKGDKTTPNMVTLEPYLNMVNNAELYYLPFIDVKHNTQPSIMSKISPTPEIPNDKLTQIFIIGLSCLGLYMLNSLIKKK